MRGRIPTCALPTLLVVAACGSHDVPVYPPTPATPERASLLPSRAQFQGDSAPANLVTKQVTYQVDNDLVVIQVLTNVGERK